jgi:hypothetical protein
MYSVSFNVLHSSLGHIMIGIYLRRLPPLTTSTSGLYAAKRRRYDTMTTPSPALPRHTSTRYIHLNKDLESIGINKLTHMDDVEV